MIECTLLAKSEWIPSLILETKKKRKLGRYHRSFFHDVDGYGRTTWVIMADIDCDVDGFLEEGKTIVEITKECIEYLNELPIKKRKTKRKVPLYGKLEFYKASIKEDENGKKRISTMMITNQRKNKYFWGEGSVVHARRKKKRIKTTN